jgi:predicted O-linked N-acetylglucosamine transferase (SPINDLY family)
MGVPVLVRAGDRYVAHMGESILHNAGLSDWIAADEEDYPRLGARVAADVAGLASLRAGMRERMLKSPLFDAPRFARNLEAAIRGMWRIWCDAQGAR